MNRFEKFFYVPYVAIYTVGIIYFSTIEHGDFVRSLNGAHTLFLDFFFKYMTYFGDGITLAVIAVALLFVNKRYGLILGLIGVVQALVSLLMKKVIFGKTPRPKNYFEDFESLHQIAGVRLYGWNSFPSGHTMTAFALATFLSFFFKNAWWSVLLLLLATLAGLSRVYLLQHFLTDILVGSLVGVLLAAVGYRVFRKYLES